MTNDNYNERYRGHLCLLEIGEQGQRKLTQSRVLVVGAGGLGSVVSLYLAAAGVGHLAIMDADVVSLSNMQRQIAHTEASIGEPKVDSACRAATSRNSHISIEPLEMMLTSENAPEIIGRYDIVADCTDSRNSRLLVSRACRDMGTPVVFASVRGFQGLLFTSVPGTATYEDIFTQAESQGAIACSVAGILNTLVGVMGSLQASEVIKCITGAGEPMTDKLLSVDLRDMSFLTLSI